MERVLPHRDVKKRIGALAVGLAADCDAPESAVEQIMRSNLANARTLPFVAFISHDGKWVGGYSGSKRSQAFLEIVEEAEKTPHLQATKAVRKKLKGLATRAGKAAGRGDWKSVMKAARDATKTTGRCPERDSLAALEKTGREWAVDQFDAAVRVAQAGGDLTEARKALSAVKKHFSGEPEAAEAAEGSKALKRLSLILAAEARDGPKAEKRATVAKAYADTRWAAIFVTPPDDGE